MGTPKWMTVLMAAGAMAMVLIVSMVIAGVAFYGSYADELVAPDELAINKPSYGAKIFDRTGRLLYEYVDDRAGLRRPVPLDEISPAFIAATISTEDDSFYTNPGVNIKGLMRAAWENLSPFANTPGILSGSGGSSITQQLVKNVYIPESERADRSVERKIKETIYAIELTRRYEKERILEWYVNQISYGGLYNGVEAAAQGYFGKSARDLTLAESALLAGIPQSPAAYDPVNNIESAIERRNDILDLLERQGRIQIGKDRYFHPTREDLDAARNEEVFIAERRFPIEAPHFVLTYVEPQLRAMFGCDPLPQVKCETLLRDGLVVTTTLDMELQDEATVILDKWISEFENISASHNGAVVVIEPKTGEILVMIGSRDYWREDIQGKNNNAIAVNSPGSAFKPFVYLTSFLKLGWGPGTVILDTPVSYREADGTEFVPTNPSRNYAGPITLRHALGNSLNIPAVKVADATGVPNVVEQAKKMGFTSLGSGYGPAIATGGVDLTPLDMTYGYSVLASGGVMVGQTPLIRHRAGEREVDPVSILKIEDAQGVVRWDIETRRKQQRVVEEEYTYLVTSILTDPQAQCATFGCGGITVPGKTVAVKTGTSEPFDPRGPNRGKIGETWAFGYTRDFVVGIWAGNADNAPIVNIFSTSISFRAMRDVMLAAYRDKAQTPFERPEKVVEETVCVPSGKKPTPFCGRTTRDLFVKDALPQEDDDWWRRVRIDIRTGLLAAPSTPPQFVQEQVMLVLPPELLKTEDDRKRAQEWATALNLPLAPTDTSTATADLPVIIYSPSAGSNVYGPVQVQGRATASQFLVYRLEFGSGASPTSWQLITQGMNQVQAGVLGVWNTLALEPGVYTLRLVVQDRTGGAVTSTVSVNVGPPLSPTVEPTGTPPAAP
jgi:membrane peptidoglycan carboxypeptidase